MKSCSSHLHWRAAQVLRGRSCSLPEAISLKVLGIASSGRSPSSQWRGFLPQRVDRDKRDIIILLGTVLILYQGFKQMVACLLRVYAGQTS